MVDVGVPLDEKARLVNGPPVLSDGNGLVVTVNLYDNNLLVRTLRDTNLFQLRRSQTVPDELLRCLGILNNLDLPAGHPAQRVNVLPALADGQAHVALFRDEDNPAELLVYHTVLCRGACDALEQGHVLHLFTSQLDLGLKHHYFSASFKTSESPGSLTTSAETGDGFSHKAPRSRLEPWKTYTGTSESSAWYIMLSRFSRAQLFARITSLARACATLDRAVLLPKSTLPVLTAMRICLFTSHPTFLPCAASTSTPQSVQCPLVSAGPQ